MSKTLIILKPDAVKRKLVGEILTRFEKRNIEITKLRQTKLTKDLVKEHYSHLLDKPFYKDIETYMLSGYVIIAVLEAENVVDMVRKMIGETNPLQAQPGTIRFDYAQTMDENIIHASDSDGAAEIEIKRFF